MDNEKMSEIEQRNLQVWKKHKAVMPRKSLKEKSKKVKVKLFGIDVRIIYTIIFILAECGFFLDSLNDGNYFRFILYTIGTALVLFICYSIGKAMQKIGQK